MFRGQPELIDLTLSDGEDDLFNEEPVHNSRTRRLHQEGGAEGIDAVEEVDDPGNFESPDDPLVVSIHFPGEENAAALNSEANKKRPLQSHPLKIIQAERKRRKERQAYLNAKRKAALEAAAKKAAEEAKKRAEEDAARRAELLEAARRNFIIIDDSSDEEEDSETNKKPPPKGSRSPGSFSKGSARRVVSIDEAPVPNGFQTRRPRPQTSNQPADSNYYRFDYTREFNWNYSQEDAFEMQERLLRESAARLQQQNIARQHEERQKFGIPRISEPIFDIAKRYPTHWQWKDAYATLGLPPGAALSIVRTQYRRLAKQYHPDKSKSADTIKKFHGISRAYRKLTES